MSIRLSRFLATSSALTALWSAIQAPVSHAAPPGSKDPRGAQTIPTTNPPEPDHTSTNPTTIPQTDPTTNPTTDPTTTPTTNPPEPDRPTTPVATPIGTSVNPAATAPPAEPPPAPECDKDADCDDGESCLDGHCLRLKPYSPPDLWPFDMPDPPAERSSGDDPPVWSDHDGDDPFARPTPKVPSLACNAAYPGVPCCVDGSGWSFEKTELDYQPWTAVGTVFGRGPVFGNNVAIDRIDPPGWTADPDYAPSDKIGGDYWQFSRDVNQQGKWWIGSSDARTGPTVLPGSRLDPHDTGTLTSPELVVSSKFIRFFIGGTVNPTQRVQLEIFAEKPSDRAALAAKYDGIGKSEMQWAGNLPIAASNQPQSWVVVRASGPSAGHEFMGRRVAWDVSAFTGRRARVVIVDSDTWSSPLGVSDGHINVDDVVCKAAIDDGATWLTSANGKPGPIGEAITPLALWGTTDTHAHPFANLAFGESVEWGDPSDELHDVYSCHHPLDAITTADGRIIRDALAPVDDVGCNSSDALNHLVDPALCGIFGFDVLHYFPCVVSLTAARVLLEDQTPLIVAHSEHGSLSPFSGGVRIGDVPAVVQAIAPAVAILPMGPNLWEAAAELPSFVPGLVPRLEWDTDDGSHSGHGIKGHQLYQKDMIRRAYEGGLRLMGLDVIDSRTLSQTMSSDVYDEWDTIRRTALGIRRMVSCGDGADPEFPQAGALCDIAAIAHDPAEARAIIGADKLAIVLGTETDELGIPRDDDSMQRFGWPAHTEDSPERQVQDLWSLGIRKVTPIHSLNNPLGGAGIFNDTYLTGTQDLSAQSDPDAVYSKDIPIPAFGVSDEAALGHLGADPDVDWDDWYNDHGGWIALDATPGEDALGDGDAITFEYGFESMLTPLGFQPDPDLAAKPFAPPFHPVGTWGAVPMVSRAQGLNHLIGPGLMCSADDRPLPLGTDPTWAPPEVHQEMKAGYRDGEANAVGLRPVGREFLKRFMQLGMIVDLDHLSQRARAEAWEVAGEFGKSAGDIDKLYPFFGVHTNDREYEKHGPFPANREDLRAAGGWNPETDRTRVEFDWTKRDGGVLSVGANAGYVPDLAPGLFDDAGVGDFGGVRNDCDYSAKSFALRYLNIVGLLGGKGVAVSTDMSPFFKPAAPRFGQGQCHLKTTWTDDMVGIDDSHDDQEKICPPDHPAMKDLPADTKDEDKPRCKLDSYPHDWYPPSDSQSVLLNDVCPIYGRLTPGCPTYDNLAHQYAEGAGVEYEDYAWRRRDGDSPAAQGDGPVEYVVAREAFENREDGAPRAHVAEVVAIGASRQMRPLKKFWNPEPVAGNTGWDINLDGFQHIGLLPDFLQDVRNVGVPWEDFSPMFNAAEDYVRMWERGCALADAAAGSDITVGCHPQFIQPDGFDPLP